MSAMARSIADAIRDQLVKLNYYAGAAGNTAAIFAERLISKIPAMSRVCPNSDPGRTKKPIRWCARFARHHGERKWKILYRERDYHGTTISTLATSGQAQRADQYSPIQKVS